MICVMSLDRDEHGRIIGERWCGTHRKTLRYNDNVRTWCGYVVHLPCGIEDMQSPTCQDCIDALERKDG
jgi:hypothetical protein